MKSKHCEDWLKELELFGWKNITDQQNLKSIQAPKQILDKEVIHLLSNKLQVLLSTETRLTESQFRNSIVPESSKEN